MKRMSGWKLIGVVGAILGVFLTPGSSSGSHKEHPYRYSDVDMPVSLAVGTVRTPEFVTGAHWYWIMVQVEKPLPFPQMLCMMGVTSNHFESEVCSSNDPLLRADWTVWDDGHIVDRGSSTTEAAAKFTKKYIFKFLGNFGAEAGKKFVVEVKFTRDGTPLNVANPHLIIVRQGYE